MIDSQEIKNFVIFCHLMDNNNHSLCVALRKNVWKNKQNIAVYKTNEGFLSTADPLHKTRIVLENIWTMEFQVLAVPCSASESKQQINNDRCCVLSSAHLHTMLLFGKYYYWWGGASYNPLDNSFAKTHNCSVQTRHLAEKKYFYEEREKNLIV